MDSKKKNKKEDKKKASAATVAATLESDDDAAAEAAAAAVAAATTAAETAVPVAVKASCSPSCSPSKRTGGAATRKRARRGEEEEQEQQKGPPLLAPSPSAAKRGPGGRRPPASPVAVVVAPLAEKVLREENQQQEQQQQQRERQLPASPSASAADAATARAASTVVRRRLLDPFSAEAAAMRLRPAAAQAADRLTALLSRAVSGASGGAASAVLVGPRGSGKSAVLAKIVSRLTARFGGERAMTEEHGERGGARKKQKMGEDGEGAAAVPSVSSARLGVVSLSGLLHADERVAFREAARQLCEAFGVDFVRSASHDDNLRFFRAVLRAVAEAGEKEAEAEERNRAGKGRQGGSSIAGGGTRSHRAVLFILDELDAFARRPRQALLYGLFDALASAGALGAAVLGVSVRVDALDLLEKRVRSRFSGRVEALPRPGGAAAVARAAAAGDSDAAAGKQHDAGGGGGRGGAAGGGGGGGDGLAEGAFDDGVALAAAAAPCSASSRSKTPDADSLPGLVLESLTMPLTSASTVPGAPRWNAAVAEALAPASAAAAMLARAELLGATSARDAASVALSAASSAALFGRLPSERDVLVGAEALLARQAGLAPRLAQLSVLELFLLAGLARAARKAGAAAAGAASAAAVAAGAAGAATFDAGFEEYAALGRAGAGADACRGRGAAWAAFERLAAAGLVARARDGRGSGRGSASAAGSTHSAAAAALRGGLAPHTRLELRPTVHEIVEAARRNRRAPPLLATWLSRDGAGPGRGAAADVV